MASLLGFGQGGFKALNCKDTFLVFGHFSDGSGAPDK